MGAPEAFATQFVVVVPFESHPAVMDETELYLAAIF